MSDLEQDWQRLDPKMLAVHPVTSLGQFVWPLLAVLVAGSSMGFRPWQLIVVVVPVLVGLWRYFTTTYRITAEHLELRQGILARKVTRARLDKVRTVTLDAGPVHRILSLAKVSIGTGDDERLVLDALATPQARALRTDLLQRRAAAPAEAEAGVAGAAAASPAEPLLEETLLRFDPLWVRFAPFTGTGVAIAAAAIAGVAGPLGSSTETFAEEHLGVLATFSLVGLIAGGLALVLVALVVLSVIGYALTNWGFTLSRNPDGQTWQSRRGLLSTTEAVVDTSRLRGVSLTRPLGLRLVGGAQLRALTTGGDDDPQTRFTLAPAAPRTVVTGLAHRLVSDTEALDSPLVAHGPLARRRQLVRPLVLAATVVAALSVAYIVERVPGWLPLLALLLLPIAAALGMDRFRALGHRLTPAHLVIGAASTSRERTLLLRSGIISWRFEQSIFQRRLGLVTLVATSAAGSKNHLILDLDEEAATGLAHEAVPGVVAQFLRSGR